jgi:hypothetical protein
MTKLYKRSLIAILIAMLAVSSMLGTASAASTPPAQAAEAIRAGYLHLIRMRI